MASKTADKSASGSQSQPATIFGNGFPTVVLASKSPRREALLKQVGLEPKVIPGHVNEAVFHRTFKEARPLVTALSQAKCRSVAADYADALVVAADTVVTVDGVVLGQPATDEDALAMLKRLQGKAHEVVTSISVSYKGRMLTDCQSTTVVMHQMDDETLARYVATGEPMDKAGGYAIQGAASAFIERIEGCYFNVVGLSLSTFRQLVGHLVG